MDIQIPERAGCRQVKRRRQPPDDAITAADAAVGPNAGRKRKPCDSTTTAQASPTLNEPNRTMLR